MDIYNPAESITLMLKKQHHGSIHRNATGFFCFRCTTCWTEIPSARQLCFAKPPTSHKFLCAISSTAKLIYNVHFPHDKTDHKVICLQVQRFHGENGKEYRSKSFIHLFHKNTYSKRLGYVTMDFV